MPATETKTTGARDVDDYLSRLPNEPRAALAKLRQTIKSFVPGATEVIRALQLFPRCCADRSPSRRVEILSNLKGYNSISCEQATSRGAGEETRQDQARRKRASPKEESEV